MREITNLSVGSRVQHRGWYLFGTITEMPDPLYWTSNVKIQIEERADEGSFPVFSLIYNPNEFVYDWSDVDEAVGGRAKSKSKKPKH